MSISVFVTYCWENVSFQGISNDIVPLSLKGREIVDLQKGSKEFEKLYAKLVGVNSVKFAEVGKELPRVSQQEIPDLIIDENKGFELEGVDEKSEHGSCQRFGKYENCRRKLNLIFINKSGKTIEGCQIELSIKNDFLYHSGYRDNQSNNLETKIESKIFPNQRIKTNLIEINITSDNFKEAEESKIIARIYSDIGEQSLKIPILECITITENHVRRKIEFEDFLDFY